MGLMLSGRPAVKNKAFKKKAAKRTPRPNTGAWEKEAAAQAMGRKNAERFIDEELKYEGKYGSWSVSKEARQKAIEELAKYDEMGAALARDELVPEIIKRAGGRFNYNDTGEW